MGVVSMSLRWQGQNA